ncbi:Bifunctional ligase/repressor BirA [Acidipropionibacterium virtanenii]|uniref:Bifunctional ligase/repressor BirA n=1 Tax=Acidipropionibacterium virtanenii TaxID=2057246 RepID=A0A344USL6_9ACTN|nr:Bifunctional ligase/repressor BirA [Acidipropionibacterium virtanenii]
MIAGLVGNGTRFTRHGADGISWLRSTGSTNADLAAWVRQGGTGFRVLVTDHQETGRGRFSRPWQDSPGTSALMSLLIPNDRPAADWGWLSMVAGLAVVRAVEEAGAQRGRVTLKWPNDVLVDAEGEHGGKLCGILSERVDGPEGPHAIIGIGLNASMGEQDLPVPTATSLALCGLPHDRARLVASIIRGVDELLGEWLADGTVRDAYRDRCDTIGSPVRLTFDPQTVGAGPRVVEGIGVDVAEDGSIVVESQGVRRSFAAADVQHLRPAG